LLLALANWSDNSLIFCPNGASPVRSGPAHILSVLQLYLRLLIGTIKGSQVFTGFIQILLQLGNLLFMFRFGCVAAASCWVKVLMFSPVVSWVDLSWSWPALNRSRALTYLAPGRPCLIVLVQFMA